MRDPVKKMTLRFKSRHHIDSGVGAKHEQGRRATKFRMGVLVVVSALFICSSCATVPSGELVTRSWASEIDVCVSATDDVPGCQWLAGLLIHRRCQMGIYQTFVAALSVGGAFEVVYEEAANSGDCE